MNESKIATAAQLCITRSLQTERPFSSVKSQIDELKSDSNWTAAEIIEVQTRVIRALMQNLGTSDPTDSPKED